MGNTPSSTGTKRRNETALGSSVRIAFEISCVVGIVVLVIMYMEKAASPPCKQVSERSELEDVNTAQMKKHFDTAEADHLVLSNQMSFGNVSSETSSLSEFQLDVWVDKELYGAFVHGQTSDYDLRGEIRKGTGQKGNIVAQVVGNETLTKAMLMSGISCTNVTDYRGDLDTNQHACRVVLITDSVVDPKTGVVTVWFNSNFLKYYENLLFSSSKEFDFMGLQVSQDVHRYLIRRFLLAPLRISVGEMRQSGPFDGDTLLDKIVPHRIFGYLMQLFGSKKSQQNILVRLEPPEWKCTSSSGGFSYPTKD
jgi:hypothetical protein